MRDTRGFGLIGLIVVIVILGILIMSSVSIFSEKAQDDVDKGIEAYDKVIDIKEIYNDRAKDIEDLNRKPWKLVSYST